MRSRALNSSSHWMGKMSRVPQLTSPANPQICTVDSTGLVQPASAGQAQLTFKAGDQTIQVPVEVASFDRARQIDFVTEVETAVPVTAATRAAAMARRRGRMVQAVAVRFDGPLITTRS